MENTECPELSSKKDLKMNNGFNYTNYSVPGLIENAVIPAYIADHEDKFFETRVSELAAHAVGRSLPMVNPLWEEFDLEIYHIDNPKEKVRIRIAAEAEVYFYMIEKPVRTGAPE